MFFKGSSGAFLVFDLSRRKTFEELGVWHEQIINSCQHGLVITLIGNKCDLPREV